MKTYNHNGIEFDDVVQNPQDWVDNDGCGEMWSQICGECQYKYSDEVVGLLDDYGSQQKNTLSGSFCVLDNALF